MSDEKLTTKVWVESGKVSRGDILSQALLDLRDKIPAATLPSADIVDAKPTKRDKVDGQLYTVEVTYRKFSDGESTVSVDQVVAGMQATPFDPSDDTNA